MILATNPSTAHPDQAQVLFWDASWEFYEAILQEYGETPQKINFDNGTIELMTLSTEHEWLKTFIGDLVNVIAMERTIPMARRGSQTLKSKPKAKGLEPDECFYIARAKEMRGVKRLDLSRDPPPDLVIEVDVEHHVVDREAIYAALGVPEMWRFKNGQLETFRLEGGMWQLSEYSLSFPFLRVSDLAPFIERTSTEDETAVLIAFRDWLRDQPS